MNTITARRLSISGNLSAQSSLLENACFKMPKIPARRINNDLLSIRSGSKRANGYSSDNDNEDIDDVVAQIEAKRKQTDCFEI